MAIELGHCAKAHFDGVTLPRLFASTEEPCFSTHSSGTDQIFAMAVVNRHLAVDQVVRERGPRVETIVQRLGRRGAIRHPGAHHL